MRILVAIVVFLFSVNLLAEETYEIVGFAPKFVGKKVNLYTYEDYITMSRSKIGEGFVNEKDSIFHIPIDVKTTIKVIIEIDRTESEIYVAPKTTYQLYFLKAINQPDGFQAKKTEVIFYGLDSTDINYRIIQYEDWFDMYVAIHSKEMSPVNFQQYLDTFKVDVANAYKDVNDLYFLTYVRYNIAEMDQAFDSKGKLRLNTYLTYIKPFPVYFENDQYMRFFKRYYSDDFGDYIPDIENEIFLALNDSSPTRLMRALKQDLFLANPEIRELVMVDKLGKAYYQEPQFRSNILVILDSVANHAAFPHSAVVAKNIIKYLTKVEPGFPAPHISYKNAKGESITWDKYKGKFVYFTVFETWNEKALAELKIINELVKEYEEDIAFLSVCTDEKPEKFNKFMSQNPELNWDILYVGRDQDLFNKFNISSVPAYYLLDQDSFIALAPAPGPSPDGEYESIDKTFFIIRKMLHPEKQIKIGEK